MLFNDGVHDVFEVTLPEGSLLNPRFPAAVSNRLNVHVRFFDCMSGALGQRAPELAMAAGYGASPYFVFSGIDEHGDGLDGHSWWPLFRTTPAEYTESYSPVRIERYAAVIDTGGAGRHRGGAGLEKEYVFLAGGEFTINDDRALTNPWGVAGGRAGGRGSKLLIRRGGDRHELPSKVDALRVEAGDRFVFRTAGAGGWGDPLERPAEHVRRDVRRLVVSAEAAADSYGVVLRDGAVDAEATADRRRRLREERGELPAFDFGDPPGTPVRFEPPPPGR